MNFTDSGNYKSLQRKIITNLQRKNLQRKNLQRKNLQVAGVQTCLKKDREWSEL